MTERIPEAAFWCLAVGLLAVIVLLVRQRGITRRQRGRSAELADALRARDEAAPSGRGPPARARSARTSPPPRRGTTTP
ncbi:hypothetical protein O1M63_42065 [Streptomyces mirabilis]|nr:hypothetical protein [Streptomyces mirabilis]